MVMQDRAYAQPMFDARAIIGVDVVTVKIENIHGSKLLRHLTQSEANRLVSSWGDLLDEKTDRVVITVF